MSGADAKITEYQAKFNGLKAEFHGQALRNTEITVLRILDNIESLQDDVQGLGGRFGGLCDPFSWYLLLVVQPWRPI